MVLVLVVLLRYVDKDAPYPHRAADLLLHPVEVAVSLVDAANQPTLNYRRRSPLPRPGSHRLLWLTLAAASSDQRKGL